MKRRKKNGEEAEDNPSFKKQIFSVFPLIGSSHGTASFLFQTQYIWRKIKLITHLKTIGNGSMGFEPPTSFDIKNGPIPAFSVYFRPFLITMSIIQIGKSVDDVHGIRTPCRRMVGADKTTELWLPTIYKMFYYMLTK